MNTIERKYTWLVNIILGQTFLVMMVIVHSYWYSRGFFPELPPAVSVSAMIVICLLPLLSIVIAGEMVTFLDKEASHRLIQQRFAFVLAAITAGVIATDESGVIVYANDATLELLGTTSSQIVGQPLAAANFSIADLLQQCGDGEIRDAEIHLRDDGTTLLVDIGVTRDDALNMIGHVVMLKDLTEIRRLQGQLLQAERLTAFGELAAVAAHEIRNPLTAIRGFLQIMKARGDTSIDSQHLDLLLGETERMNGLIHDMVAFAGPARERFRLADLNRIVQDCLTLSVPSDAEGITVEAQLEDDLPPIQVKPEEIKQVILNLFRNAVQAMPGGGILRITTGRRPGGFIFLEVSDTGCGVPSGLGDRIFEPFVSTKAQGMGLGLSICRRIIDEHGGTIMIAPSSVPGATFVVSLPEETTGAAGK